MTILVTGASGFIGGELTRALVSRGERVRILVRPTSNLTGLDGLDLETAFGDLADEESLAVATRGVSVVYNCAARVEDWGPWAEFETANVTGVENLLRAAAQTDTLERFVHVSTSDVYGYPRVAGDESSPMKDVGYPYNRSKILGERHVVASHRHTGLPTTIIRPVTVFGPRSTTVPTEFARLLLAGELPLIAGGRSRGGFIYSDDLVDAMITAASAAQAVGQAYNLRDPSDMTWEEAILLMMDGLGVAKHPRSIPRAAAVVAAYAMEGAYRVSRKKSRPLLTRHVVDLLTRDQGYGITKAQRELGFAPKVGVDEGWRRSIEWLQTPEGREALATER